MASSIPEPKRVLVVDDVDVVRQSASMYLASLGYKVDSAISGRDALRLMDLNHYDVIITDLVMTDGDGAEVIATARRNGVDCPIIAMTGRDFIPKSDYSKLARGLGATAFISKPFEMSGLRTAVEGVLSRPVG